jgi:hypothetical protein
VPEFRAYVDGLIADAPLAKPVDAEARFQSNLAEVSR